MEMTQAAAAYFEENAAHWDALRTTYFGEEVRQAALAQGYLRREHVVADIGAGTGFIAAGLAPLVSQVHVVDGSAAMLEVARQNLASHANITYHLSTGGTLPLPEGSVDAAFANMFLHHCPDPAAAIAEMARILKPGGRLILTEMDAHKNEWLRSEMADEWLGFARADIKRWLRAAGLVNVLVDYTGESCCAASQAEPARSAQISVFVAAGARRIAAREQVRERYGATAERVSAEGTCCGSAAPSVGADIIPLTGSCCAPASEDATPAANTSCCSPAYNAMPEVGGAPEGTTFIWATGYHPEQLKDIPAEAAALALGCGNPTAFAALRPGETVLDIGSGGGIDAFFAAQLVGPAGRVIGVDMTPQMLERARASAARAGLSNVEFREGHAEALPVADDTVDVIMSNCVINLCEDKGRVFEEAYRVLKPGGRLAISDTVLTGSLPDALRSDAASWGACISGALPHREYLDLVRAAGFRDVHGERSLSRGALGDVEMYSLSVTAVK